MVDPPPWPSRPPGTRDFDLFWLVPHIPPDPFPDESYDYAADPRFGPPGTRWVFSLESLWNRMTAPGASQGAKLAAERLVKKLGLKAPPAGSTSWATPEPQAPPATPIEQELIMPMHWIRTAINATIGTDEEVVHVVNWRHSTTENAPIDNAGLKAFGDVVRDKWAAMWQEIRGNFPDELVYRDVRTSKLVQDAPGQKPAWPNSTAVSPFGTGNPGGSSALALPYEVAMGISLNTNWRGTSRFRGRLYMGPCTVAHMGADGQFSAPAVEAVGQLFGQTFLAGVEAATDYECHIISQKFNTSAKVIGVRMGKTPDSQRRRRRDRPEAYTQVWGLPVGSL